MNGLPTGIGSLPYKDVDTALDLVFNYTPHIPFWPQLPKRNIREGMIAQFSEGMPCIEVTDKGVFFNPENKEKDLEKFYERIIAQDVDYFRISEDFASGLHRFYQRLSKPYLKKIEYIKCQVTGPFTFAASIKDENGKALLHDSVFMQAISKCIVMKALWQVKFLEKFGKKIIVFIDEPYLGCFGSAYTPINREDVVNVLAESGENFNEVMERLLSKSTENLISQGYVLLGVHCCGNTDWSIFTDISAIDIISFDAFNFLDRILLYADQLHDFFKRGGVLAWGIVPTEGFGSEINPDLLSKRLKAGMGLLVKKGVNKDLLNKRLLITPSCGLGILDSDKAESIFKCLAGLSSVLKI